MLLNKLSIEVLMYLTRSPLRISTSFISKTRELSAVPSGQHRELPTRPLIMVYKILHSLRFKLKNTKSGKQEMNSRDPIGNALPVAIVAHNSWKRKIGQNWEYNNQNVSIVIYDTDIPYRLYIYNKLTTTTLIYFC